ncbi:hypothetical protein [Terriglobus albidus]|nr:hypothetical protein [Terriglobus albidus]
MHHSSEPQNEMLKGILDMWMLRTLVRSNTHKDAIAKEGDV